MDPKRPSALRELVARLNAIRSVRAVQRKAFSFDVELAGAITASIEFLELVKLGRRRLATKRKPAPVDDVEQEQQYLRDFLKLIEETVVPPPASKKSATGAEGNEPGSPCVTTAGPESKATQGQM
jgi:hypothetical protein